MQFHFNPFLYDNHRFSIEIWDHLEQSGGVYVLIIKAHVSVQQNNFRNITRYEELLKMDCINYAISNGTF